VLVGPNAIAGEWGHNALPWPDASEWPGPACYCGRHGCIETFLSGSGLQNALTQGSGLRTGHALGPGLTAREIAAAATRGDSAAASALETYSRRLAKSLATVMNLLDPDVIVLGGGLSNIESLYTRVPEIWTEWVFSDRVDTRLARAVHGDSSGVRGAAWLWPPT
jgi:fructokinase